MSTETFHLPLWVEYVKALGTPVVALLASLIAGAIAYRQWKTARNKLKLDLFDKRMEIYGLSVDMLNSIRGSDTADFTAVEKLEKKLHAARWLFDKNVELYLHQSALMAIEQLKKRPPPKINLTADDLAYIQASTSQREDIYQMNRRSLDKVFAPFLSLEH